MQDVIINAFQIVGICLLIAIVAAAAIVFRPGARRRRRRRRHSQRPRIDLFKPSHNGPPDEVDA